MLRLWNNGGEDTLNRDILEKIENIDDERLIRALFYMIAGYEKKAEK